MATGGYASVAERVRAGLEPMPAAERRVARALLAHYPSAGLESASRLAERAGASTPTVVRFAARLGYRGYRELQHALLEEVEVRTAPPMELPARPEADPSGGLRALGLRVADRALHQTFGALPEADLASLVELLGDPRRRVTSVGGRLSHVLAEYLDLHLRVMRPDTRSLHLGPDTVPAFLVDTGRRDVVVVFDFRRYQRDVVELARGAHRRGASVVLVTDPWLSPAADVADLVLSVRVEGASPFDSLVPAFAVVEIVIAGVLARLGTAAQRRLSEAEEASGDVTLA
ncbi:MAG: MurR/RpiR family transcriptional regulator [Actinomycetes bacterium]